MKNFKEKVVLFLGTSLISASSIAAYATPDISTQITAKLGYKQSHLNFIKDRFLPKDNDRAISEQNFKNLKFINIAVQSDILINENFYLGIQAGHAFQVNSCKGNISTYFAKDRAFYDNLSKSNKKGRIGKYALLAGYRFKISNSINDFAVTPVVGIEYHHATFPTFKEHAVDLVDKMKYISPLIGVKTSFKCSEESSIRLNAFYLIPKVKIKDQNYRTQQMLTALNHTGHGLKVQLEGIYQINNQLSANLDISWKHLQAKDNNVRNNDKIYKAKLKNRIFAASAGLTYTF